MPLKVLCILFISKLGSYFLDTLVFHLRVYAGTLFDTVCGYTYLGCLSYVLAKVKLIDGYFLSKI